MHPSEINVGTRNANRNHLGTTHDMRPYDGARWKALVARLRAKQPFCQDPFGRHSDARAIGGKVLVTHNLIIHHIIPVNVDPTLTFAIQNLVTLCPKCHAEAHHIIDNYLAAYIWSLSPFAKLPWPDKWSGAVAIAQAEGRGCENLATKWPTPSCESLTKMHGVLRGTPRIKGGVLQNQ